MKKKLLKILIYVSIFSMLLTLCSGFASAVDPVSAATMANALAQAITAYGASQGVSMTFDVTNSSGIGVGLHDLWNQFVEDVNDSNTPTYDSLAVTMWSNMYSKIGNNLGINISASEMPFIDSFWNWLLSGPAEMVKVDNEYAWSINQDNTVDPIVIYSSSPFYSQPIPYLGTSTPQLSVLQSEGIPAFSYVWNNRDDVTYIGSLYNGIYSFIVNDGGSSVNIISVSFDSNINPRFWYGSTSVNDSWSVYNSSLDGVSYRYSTYTSSYSSSYKFYLPVFTTMSAGVQQLIDISNGVANFDDIQLIPYIGDATPQNVYIPDNTDVNYNPIDVAIPLDILWDNTLFGDGDGTLTDAQSEAAVSAADDAITDSVEKTLTIAETDNPDVPAPNEVYIPFLPLQLPSFNFSLSGIWHYVVTWVGTLGSWFTAMFNMWSCLPYAMVVPVYATLVVVIVLGVYRRFLS